MNVAPFSAKKAGKSTLLRHQFITIGFAEASPAPAPLGPLLIFHQLQGHEPTQRRTKNAKERSHHR